MRLMWAGSRGYRMEPKFPAVLTETQATGKQTVQPAQPPAAKRWAHIFTESCTAAAIRVLSPPLSARFVASLRGRGRTAGRSAGAGADASCCYHRSCPAPFTPERLRLAAEATECVMQVPFAPLRSVPSLFFTSRRQGVCPDSWDRPPGPGVAQHGQHAALPGRRQAGRLGGDACHTVLLLAGRHHELDSDGLAGVRRERPAAPFTPSTGRGWWCRCGSLWRSRCRCPGRRWATGSSRGMACTGGRAYRPGQADVLIHAA